MKGRGVPEPEDQYEGYSFRPTPEPPKEAPSRGWLGDIANTVARIPTVAAPETIGRGIEAFAPETGKSLVEFSERMSEKFPQSKEQQEGGFRSDVLGGLESGPLTYIAPTAGAIIGGLTAGVPGALAGWGLGALGTAPLFGESSRNRFLAQAEKEAIAKGKDPIAERERVQPYAVGVGMIEASDIALDALFGPLAGIGKAVMKQAGKKTLKHLLSPSLMTAMGKGMAWEGATEATQNVGQEYLTEQAGMDSVGLLRAGVSGLIGGATMGLVLGGATQGINLVKQKAVRDTLTNSVPTDFDPQTFKDSSEVRNKMADLVARDLSQNEEIGKDVSTLWRKYADMKIQRNEPIDLNVGLDKLSLEIVINEAQIQQDLGIKDEHEEMTTPLKNAASKIQTEEAIQTVASQPLTLEPTAEAPKKVQEITEEPAPAKGVPQPTTKTTEAKPTQAEQKTVQKTTEPKKRGRSEGQNLGLLKAQETRRANFAARKAEAEKATVSQPKKTVSPAKETVSQPEKTVSQPAKPVSQAQPDAEAKKAEKAWKAVRKEFRAIKHDKTKESEAKVLKAKYLAMKSEWEAKYPEEAKGIAIKREEAQKETKPAVSNPEAEAEYKKTLSPAFKAKMKLRGEERKKADKGYAKMAEAFDKKYPGYREERKKKQGQPTKPKATTTEPKTVVKAFEDEVSKKGQPTKPKTTTEQTVVKAFEDEVSKKPKEETKTKKKVDKKTKEINVWIKTKLKNADRIKYAEDYNAWLQGDREAKTEPKPPEGMKESLKRDIHKYLHKQHKTPLNYHKTAEGKPYTTVRTKAEHEAIKAKKAAEKAEVKPETTKATPTAPTTPKKEKKAPEPKFKVGEKVKSTNKKAHKIVGTITAINEDGTISIKVDATGEIVNKKEKFVKGVTGVAPTAPARKSDEEKDKELALKRERENARFKGVRDEVRKAIEEGTPLPKGIKLTAKEKKLFNEAVKPENRQPDYFVLKENFGVQNESGAKRNPTKEEWEYAWSKREDEQNPRQVWEALIAQVNQEKKPPEKPKAKVKRGKLPDALDYESVREQIVESVMNELEVEKLTAEQEQELDNQLKDNLPDIVKALREDNEDDYKEARREGDVEGFYENIQDDIVDAFMGETSIVDDMQALQDKSEYEEGLNAFKEEKPKTEKPIIDDLNDLLPEGSWLGNLVGSTYSAPLMSEDEAKKFIAKAEANGWHYVGKIEMKGMVSPSFQKNEDTAESMANEAKKIVAKKTATARGRVEPIPEYAKTLNIKIEPYFRLKPMSKEWHEYYASNPALQDEMDTYLELREQTPTIEQLVDRAFSLDDYHEIANDLPNILTKDNFKEVNDLINYLYMKLGKAYMGGMDFPQAYMDYSSQAYDPIGKEYGLKPGETLPIAGGLTQEEAIALHKKIVGKKKWKVTIKEADKMTKKQIKDALDDNYEKVEQFKKLSKEKGKKIKYNPNPEQRDLVNTLYQNTVGDTEIDGMVQSGNEPELPRKKWQKYLNKYGKTNLYRYMKKFKYYADFADSFFGPHGIPKKMAVINRQLLMKLASLNPEGSPRKMVTKQANYTRKRYNEEGKRVKYFPEWEELESSMELGDLERMPDSFFTTTVAPNVVPVNVNYINKIAREGTQDLRKLFADDTKEVREQKIKDIEAMESFRGDYFNDTTAALVANRLQNHLQLLKKEVARDLRGKRHEWGTTPEVTEKEWDLIRQHRKENRGFTDYTSKSLDDNDITFLTEKRAWDAFRYLYRISSVEHPKLQLSFPAKLEEDFDGMFGKKGELSAASTLDDTMRTMFIGEPEEAGDDYNIIRLNRELRNGNDGLLDLYDEHKRLYSIAVSVPMSYDAAAGRSAPINLERLFHAVKAGFNPEGQETEEYKNIVEKLNKTRQEIVDEYKEQQFSPEERGILDYIKGKHFKKMSLEDFLYVGREQTISLEGDRVSETMRIKAIASLVKEFNATYYDVNALPAQNLYVNREKPNLTDVLYDVLTDPEIERIGRLELSKRGEFKPDYRRIEFVGERPVPQEKNLQNREKVTAQEIIQYGYVPVRFTNVDDLNVALAKADLPLAKTVRDVPIRHGMLPSKLTKEQKKISDLPTLWGAEFKTIPVVFPSKTTYNITEESKEWKNPTKEQIKNRFVMVDMEQFFGKWTVNEPPLWNDTAKEWQTKERYTAWSKETGKSAKRGEVRMLRVQKPFAPQEKMTPNEYRSGYWKDGGIVVHNGEHALFLKMWSDPTDPNSYKVTPLEIGGEYTGEKDIENIVGGQDFAATGKQQVVFQYMQNKKMWRGKADHVVMVHPIGGGSDTTYDAKTMDVVNEHEMIMAMGKMAMDDRIDIVYGEDCFMNRNRKSQGLEPLTETYFDSVDDFANLGESIAPKFQSVSNVSYFDMEPTIQQTFRQFNKLLNINPRIIFIDQMIALEMQDYIPAIAYREARRRGYLATTVSSSMFDWTTGKVPSFKDEEFYIIISPELQNILTADNPDGIRILSHEYGHVVMTHALRQAKPELRDAIHVAHTNWRNEAENMTFAQFKKHLKSHMRVKWVQDLQDANGWSDSTIAKKAMDSPYQKDKISGQTPWAYVMSKQEWFADNVSTWALSAEKPSSILDKFFKKVADTIRKLVAILNNEYGAITPDLSVINFLEAMQENRWRRANSTDEHIQKGMRTPKDLTGNPEEEVKKIQKRLTISRADRFASPLSQAHVATALNDKGFLNHMKSLFEKKFFKLRGDIGWIQSTFSNPFWLGQKYLDIRKAVDIQMKRDEKRIALIHKFLKQVESFNALKGESLKRVEKALIEGDRELPQEMRRLMKAKDKEAVALLKQLDGYSDNTLRTRFKLNPQEIKAYRDVRGMLKDVHRRWKDQIRNQALQAYKGTKWYGLLLPMLDEKPNEEESKWWRDKVGSAWNERENAINAAKIPLEQLLITPKDLKRIDEKTIKILDDAINRILGDKALTEEEATAIVEKAIKRSTKLLAKKKPQELAVLTADMVKQYMKHYNKVKKNIDELREHLRAVYAAQGDSVVDDHELNKDIRDLINAYGKTKPKLSKLKALRNKLTYAVAYFPRERDDKKLMYFAVYEKKMDEKTKLPYRGELLYINYYNTEMLGGKDIKKEAMKRLKDAGYNENNIEIDNNRNVRQADSTFFRVSDYNTQRVINNALQSLTFSSKLSAEHSEKINDILARAISDDMNNRAFGKHRIRRKGFDEDSNMRAILGYKENDLQNVLFNYITGYAGLETKTDASLQFTELLGGIDKRKPGVWNYLKSYVDDQLRNQEKIDKYNGAIRAAMFFWYLGGSIKAAFVQLTQNFVTGIPFLGQAMRHYYKGKSKKTALMEAERGYFKAMKDIGFGRLTDEERKFIQELLDNGVAMDQYIQEVTGQLSRTMGSKFNKVVKFFARPFSEMEAFNRKSAGLAMFRFMKAQGVSTSMKDADGVTIKGSEGSVESAAGQAAVEFIYKTHYLMGKSNLPQPMRGADIVGQGLRGLYTFRSFTHNYALSFFYGKDISGKEKIRTLLHSLAYLGLLGGLFALPFLKDFFDWWQKMFGEDIVAGAKDNLRKFGGEAAERAGLYGIVGLVLGDISGSLKIGVPFMGDPADTVYGAVGGMMTKAVRAGKAFATGDTYRGVENLMPEMIANPMRAMRMSEFGKETFGTPGIATNPHGRVMWGSNDKPVQFTGWDVARKIASFQPVNYSEAMGELRATNDIEAYFDNKRIRIGDRYRVARQNRDTSGIADAMKRLQEFNKERIEKGVQTLIPPMKLSTLAKSMQKTSEEKKETRYKKQVYGRQAEI